MGVNEPAPESLSLEKLADSIRAIYASDPAKGEERIEKSLEAELERFSIKERIVLLDQLRRKFEGSPSVGTQGAPGNLEGEVLTNLFSLLLGHKVTKPDLSSSDLLEKLSASLNTIFDSLNELVGVITATFTGEQAELQTIRHIIGSDIQGMGETQSLEAHLFQIKEAFLLVNRAFKIAAKSEVAKILAELDPQHLESEAEKGMKFGFMRKAELYEIYQGKFERCMKWLESERFDEEFSREFEKVCQTLYKKKGE
jgi:hypothetical protein